LHYTGCSGGGFGFAACETRWRLAAGFAHAGVNNDVSALLVGWLLVSNAASTLAFFPPADDDDGLITRRF
jgi:hypothetical protein